MLPGTAVEPYHDSFIDEKNFLNEKFNALQSAIQRQLKAIIDESHTRMFADLEARQTSIQSQLSALEHLPFQINLIVEMLRQHFAEGAMVGGALTRMGVTGVHQAPAADLPAGKQLTNPEGNRGKRSFHHGSSLEIHQISSAPVTRHGSVASYAGPTRASLLNRRSHTVRGSTQLPSIASLGPSRTANPELRRQDFADVVTAVASETFHIAPVPFQGRPFGKLDSLPHRPSALFPEMPMSGAAQGSTPGMTKHEVPRLSKISTAPSAAPSSISSVSPDMSFGAPRKSPNSTVTVDSRASSHKKNYEVGNTGNHAPKVSETARAHAHWKIKTVGRKTGNLLAFLKNPDKETEHDPRCLLLPYSMLALYWAVTTIFATVLTGVLVPFGHVYFPRGTFATLSVLPSVIYIADAVFLLDIVVHFRTAVSDGGTYLETNASKIASIYIRSWFFVDFIAAWPAFTAPVDGTLYWIIRFLKLLRILRLPKLFGQLRQAHHSMHITAVEVATFVFMFANCLACLWRTVQRADEHMADEPSRDWWALYIEDLYWVQMTMTTVGYGDIHPVGWISRLYCIFAMSVASVMFGSTISVMTHTSKSLFDDEVEARVGEAIEFMKRRDISDALQKRVQTNLRQRLRMEKEYSQADLMKFLSPALQRDLSLGLLNATVLRFPLFKDAQHSFVGELAAAHVWVNCLPGDIVAERGQAVQELVFLTRGEIVGHFDKPGCNQYLDVGIMDEEMEVNQLLSDVPSLDETCEDGTGSSEFGLMASRNTHIETREIPSLALGHAKISTWSDHTWVDNIHAEQDDQEVTIGAGAWFGESCLFDLEHIRAATLCAVLDTELAVLTATAYRKVIAKYPHLLDRHHKIQERIHDGSLDVRNLAYRSRDHAPTTGAGNMGYKGLQSGQSSTAILKTISDLSKTKR